MPTRTSARPKAELISAGLPAAMAEHSSAWLPAVLDNLNPSQDKEFIAMRLDSGSLGDNARNLPLLARASYSKFRLVFLALLLASAGGCESEKRVPVFPVSGKVSFQGQAPVGAQVVLHPVGANASNEIAPGRSAMRCNTIT